MKKVTEAYKRSGMQGATVILPPDIDKLTAELDAGGSGAMALNTHALEMYPSTEPGAFSTAIQPTVNTLL